MYTYNMKYYLICIKHFRISVGYLSVVIKYSYLTSNNFKQALASLFLLDV